MLKSILHLILPHRCLKCEIILNKETGLCPECWSKIHFITAPFCYQCGVPLEVDLGPKAICGTCSKGNHYFSHVRSLFAYDDASRNLVLKFKHGDALHGAPYFAMRMTQVAEDILEDADILAPVPLHWLRLMKRTYNQAHVLGKEVSRLQPTLEYLPGLLRRIKATQSQGYLSRSQRQLNVQGSINLDKRQKNRIKGKRILLVDDILTSGATINTCAKALLKDGAERVDAMTLGRATRG